MPEEKPANKSTDAYQNLWGTGVPGVEAALKRPIPSEKEVPWKLVEGYPKIAVDILVRTSDHKNFQSKSGQQPKIREVTVHLQGLRLKQFDRLCKDRGKSSSTVEKWRKLIKEASAKS